MPHHACCAWRPTAGMTLGNLFISPYRFAGSKQRAWHWHGSSWTQRTQRDAHPEGGSRR